MSDSFSPLFAGRSSGQGQRFRVQVVNAGALAAASPPSAPAPAAHASCDPAKAPRVSLEKNGDTVTGIRIDCGCGQVIQLECVY
jgi:hypothetical protein